MPLRNPFDQPDGMGGLMSRLGNNPWINMGAGMSPRSPITRGTQFGLSMHRDALGRQADARVAQQEWDIKEQQRRKGVTDRALGVLKQTRERRYIESLTDPNQRTIANAMGADAHATKLHEEWQRQNEIVSYQTPTGPQMMPRFAGERDNLMPSVVYEQSREAQRAAKIHAERNQEQPMTDYQRRSLEINEETAARAKEKHETGVAAKEKQAAINIEDALDDADLVYDKVAEALEMIDSGWFTSGIGSGIASSIGGTSARSLRGTLLTIKSNVALGALIELKKSGGTLGAISKAELDLLESNLASLDQQLADDVLIRNLNQIRDIYTKIYRELGGKPRKGEKGYVDPATDPDAWSNLVTVTPNRPE